MSGIQAQMVANSGHHVQWSRDFAVDEDQLVARNDWSSSVLLGFTANDGQAFGSPGSDYNAGTNTGYRGPKWWMPRNAANATTCGLYEVRYILTSLQQPDGFTAVSWASISEGGGVAGPPVGNYSTWKPMIWAPYIVVAGAPGYRTKAQGIWEIRTAATTTPMGSKNFTIQQGMT